MENHYVICGFGATGQSAAQDLVRRGVEPGQIVAIIRDGERLPPSEVDAEHIEPNDRLVVLTDSAANPIERRRRSR